MKQSTKSGNDVATRDWEGEAARLQGRAHDMIRERPLLALALAVAGGYLAGRVFSRV
jgi:hypothetical protein